jgi:Ni,Fe-hydrogenase III large subunit
VLSIVAHELATLSRLLERSGSLTWSTEGVGITAPELVAGRRLGPVARAAGLVDDARSEDAAYRALGFEPIVQPPAARGDARARWRQRLAEARQSLDLAQRAGDRVAGPGAAEGPRGRGNVDPPPIATLLSLLPALLSGAEWGDAVATVVSLDLELRGG